MSIECCICLSDIEKDAIILDPCCHYLHNNCYVTYTKFNTIDIIKCPSCTIKIDKIVPFENDNWTLLLNDINGIYDNDDNKFKQDIFSLLDTSFKNLKNKDNICITLKNLDDSLTINVPANWLVRDLKEFICLEMCVPYSTFRFVTKGSILCYDEQLYNEQIIYMIEQISGS